MATMEEDIKEIKNGISILLKELVIVETKKIDTEIPVDAVELDENVCADLFKALSNEERLKILKALKYEDKYFAQLKDLTELDHSPLRFHLTVLKEVNLIGQERFRGKYSITDLGNNILSIATLFYMSVCKGVH